MSEGVRRTASTAMAILGALLAIAGGIALYTREEIFKADPFANRAVRTLDHEQVREALARPIVDTALDGGPDELINATPILETAVDSALQSRAFHKLFRAAAVKTHRVLFDGEADQVGVTVEDVNVVVKQAIGAISPELARAVPDDIGTRVVEISESRTALTAARSAENARFLGVVLPILGLLLLSGSIVLAPDRRRALLWCTASLAVSAGLGLALWLIARSLTLSQFADDTVRAAAGDAWLVYFGDLRTWLLAIGGVATLAAAAAAMGREVDPVAPARAVADRALTGPATAAGRVGRALLFLTAGLLLFLEPELALELVALVLGHTRSSSPAAS